MMKTRPILAFVAALALSFAAHAHDCSGGAGGGMDATGNQCNDEAASATVAMPSTDVAPPTAAAVAKQPGAASTAAMKPVSSNAHHRAHRAAKKQRHATTI